MGIICSPSLPGTREVIHFSFIPRFSILMIGSILFGFFTFLPVFFSGFFTKIPKYFPGIFAPFLFFVLAQIYDNCHNPPKSQIFFSFFFAWSSTLWLLMAEPFFSVAFPFPPDFFENSDLERHAFQYFWVVGMVIIGFLGVNFHTAFINFGPRFVLPGIICIFLIFFFFSARILQTPSVNLFFRTLCAWAGITTSPMTTNPETHLSPYLRQCFRKIWIIENLPFPEKITAHFAESPSLLRENATTLFCILKYKFESKSPIFSKEIEILSHWVQRFPHYRPLRTLLAEIAFWRKDFRLAWLHWRELQRGFPIDLDSRVKMEWCAQENQPPTAETTARVNDILREIRKNSHEIKNWIWAGRLFFKAGDLEMAGQILKTHLDEADEERTNVLKELFKIFDETRDQPNLKWALEQLTGEANLTPEESQLYRDRLNQVKIETFSNKN